MTRIVLSPREAVRLAEGAAIGTARAHLTAARALYDQERWPQACFLAMTAIEEIGKALLIQRSDSEGELPERRDLTSHDPKAILGSVSTVIFNDAARERHGTNPTTGLARIEAVRYVAEGSEWKGLREACLYVDCRPSARTLDVPAENITRDHAYLMIVAALEGLAEFHSPGFTYRKVSAMDVEKLDETRTLRLLAELTEFQQRERANVDLDRLDIVGSPEKVAQLREAVRKARTPSAQPKDARDAGETAVATLERAIEIAARLHAGQADKGGAPYILHPLRVMFRVASAEARAVAVLHDVIEDCGVTAADLRAEGFSAEIVESVVTLTRKDGESYDEFITRVARNPLAREVKIADLTENMDLSRLGREPNEKDRQRVAKYERSLAQLRDV